jgi:hypothetical protein
LSLPSARREQYVAERLDELRRASQRYKNELLRLMALHKALIAPVNNVAVKFGREFEVSGVDVVLSVSTSSNEFVKQPDWWRTEYQYFWHHGYWSQSFEIELKPIIGDDYPAVLRQMKANKSAVLFVGEYRGQGASQEQFVKTMATADIRVVFARDIGVP